jgi:hypothetical protein
MFLILAECNLTRPLLKSHTPDPTFNDRAVTRAGSARSGFIYLQTASARSMRVPVSLSGDERGFPSSKRHMRDAARSEHQTRSTGNPTDHPWCWRCALSLYTCCERRIRFGIRVGNLRTEPTPAAETPNPEKPPLFKLQNGLRCVCVTLMKLKCECFRRRVVAAHCYTVVLVGLDGAGKTTLSRTVNGGAL